MFDKCDFKTRLNDHELADISHSVMIILIKAQLLQYRAVIIRRPVTYCVVMVTCRNFALAGPEKKLNSSLPFGQVALKFCLPWAGLRLLFLQFSRHMTCLGPCPLGK